MTQQIGILGIIDVEMAFETRTLQGCTYFFDNAAPFGSRGIGTDHLVSAVHGASWCDGSQATQPVLNFVLLGVTSLPATLPRSYAYIRTALAAPRTGELRTVLPIVPLATDFLVRQTGQRLSLESRDDAGDAVQVPPLITNITGEAVEQGIIFPAQYGSPDLVNGGWYWSATVATHAPRVWSYTLHILLQRPAAGGDGRVRWERLELTCNGSLDISTAAMRNGFTRGAIGFLPIGGES